ncbi:DUF21 domain-containing protein [candidate division WOR-3 bacterium]|nr:DUF21 domain-containing protein [candidate division WOR-3 bacterium]
MTLIVYSSLVCLCLLLLAMFTSSELALVSARSEKVAGTGSRGKKSALKILGKVEENLSALLVGMNICIVAMSTLTESLFDIVFKQHNAVYSVIFDFAVILLLGEIIPKSLSKINSSSSILFLSPFIYYSSVILKPFSVFINAFSSKMLDVINVRYTGERRVSDFDNAVRDFSREGMLAPHSRILEGGVDALRKLKVSALMKPRKSAAFCKEENGYEGALSVYRKTGHSKIVSIGKNIDDVRGVYYIRDSVKKSTKSPRPPFFMYEKASFIKALEIFSDIKDDLAVCVDEYGQVTGILTRVDLILCFSNIFYLSGKNPFVLKRKKNGDFVFRSETRLGLLADLYDLDLSREYYDGDCTVSSYILDLKRSIPGSNEVFFFDKLSLTVEESTVKEIRSVSVKKSD